MEPTAPGSGQVRASLEASCRLLEFGAEVTLTYSARAEGANRLSRVRLLMNGRTEFDSGEISQLELAGNKVVGVNPGGQHDLQLVANSPGTRPTTARSFVRCPRAPAGPRL